MSNRKQRIYVPNRTRAELQKEINSKCPICKNCDVGHFQIHHIDENPSNNNKTNLLMICPTCHSKITKGDILKAEVVEIKSNLNNNSTIQFVLVTVDSENCGWEPIQNVANAFRITSLKSFFPIFDFIFINNSSHTVVLTQIKVSRKHLPVGLSGPIVPLPIILRPVILYKIRIPTTEETVTIALKDQIEIPAQKAFKFQIELFSDSMEVFAPQFKYVLNFSFGFNNDFYINIPKILLNASSDYDKLRHVKIN